MGREDGEMGQGDEELGRWGKAMRRDGARR